MRLDSALADITPNIALTYTSAPCIWQLPLFLGCALCMQLRDHLADLAVAARASGLRCDMLRGTIAQAGEAAALKEIQGFTRSEKESLRLLRLARDRIAADAHSKCVLQAASPAACSYLSWVHAVEL